MSFVTDVVAHVESFDNPDIHRLLRSRLNVLDVDGAGGSKAFQGELYAGAFNYLKVKDFKAWFRNLPWLPGDEAVLSLVSDDEAAEVVVITDGGPS